jgi:AcrR family transcriptional regulator
MLSDAQMLSRARAAFVEHGDHARTRQISKAVGAAWGVIAWSFGDKQSLLINALSGIDNSSIGCLVSSNRRDLLAYFAYRHFHDEKNKFPR